MIKKLLTGTALLCLSQFAQAFSVDNTSFETGNFEGWQVSTANGGAAGVVQYEPVDAVNATDGNYFAKLAADALLYQSFSWSQGTQLTFDWNFRSNDEAPYDDYSYLVLFTAANQILEAVILADVNSTGSYQSTGWQTYQYQFNDTGTGFIGFGVNNAIDEDFDSWLFIDNVRVNETPAFALWGLGLAGLAVRRLKKDN